MKGAQSGFSAGCLTLRGRQCENPRSALAENHESVAVSCRGMVSSAYPVIYVYERSSSVVTLASRGG